MQQSLGLASMFVAAMIGADALAGPEWVEDDFGSDAGPLPVSGQTTAGRGELTGVRGRLSSIVPEGRTNLNAGDIDFDDLYLVFIEDPANFRATTAQQFGGDTNFDSRLYVFSPDGFGLLGNDDTFIIGRGEGVSMGSTLTSFATDKTGFVLDKPGLYYIAVTTSPRFPSNEMGEIFDLMFSGEVSGPDGFGAELPIQFWGEPVRGGKGRGEELGDYVVRLQGVTFAVPDGACCLPDGSCELMGEEQCLAAGGTYQGDLTDCDGGICDLCGDLDGDGDVDNDDLQAMLAAYGSSTGDPNFDADADLNNDGEVGLVDYGIWFECYENFGV